MVERSDTTGQDGRSHSMHPGRGARPANTPNAAIDEILMSSTYLSLHYHLIFSTKERRPYSEEVWRDKLHGYLGGTIRGLGGIP